MKIKLDECIDSRLSPLLRQRGHDAFTVLQQGIQGITDEKLYHHCKDEGYIIVSLDKHFSNVLRFKPEPTSGIVVLRGPNDLFATTRILIKTLVDGLHQENPEGKLWFVEPGRIRIYEGSED